MKSIERLARALRILVVDDDPVVRDALQQVLHELGYDCSTAESGAEALEVHRERPFDIVLSDWLMPEMDGLELCRRIRRFDRNHYTYVIFITGLVDEAHLVEALRGGADGYVTKPVDVAQLEAHLVPAARITMANRVLVRKNASLRRGSERSFHAARVDPLTELGNRLRLQEDLDALSVRAGRTHDRFCLAICDVDRFKAYNDRFGHVAGDEALRLVARALRRSVRSGDAVYRYGGEEFVVLLARQSLVQAAAVMDRVRLEVERLAIRHAEGVPGGVITISAGVTELADPLDAEHRNACLERADRALYRAKSKGRNRVEVDAGPAVPAAASTRCSLSVPSRSPPR